MSPITSLFCHSKEREIVSSQSARVVYPAKFFFKCQFVLVGLANASLSPFVVSILQLLDNLENVLWEGWYIFNYIIFSYLLVKWLLFILHLSSLSNRHRLCLLSNFIFLPVDQAQTSQKDRTQIEKKSDGKFGGGKSKYLKNLKNLFFAAR